MSIDGLPTSSGNLTSVSFGSNATPSFNTSAWNAAKASSITGTLSFGAAASLGDRSMTLSFSGGLSITSPRALFITPAPKVSGYSDGAPRSFPFAVENSGLPQQITIVGSNFATTTKSGLTPIASVSGGNTDVAVETFYDRNQTTGYLDPSHLFVSFTSTTCSGGSDSLTIRNPTQAGSAGIPGIVGGSVTISNAISVSCVPEIDSITPDMVPADSQFHTITISGRNFAPGATVSNSNNPADYENTTVVDSNTITTSIRGVVPMDIGIIVTNPNGARNVDAEPFTFQSVPSFTSFYPLVVPLDSNPHTVTIVGSQFLPGAVLSVDSGSVGSATLGTTTYIDYNHLSVSVTGVTGVTGGAIDLTVDNTDGGTATQVDAIGIGVAPAITAASLSGTPTVGSSIDANVTATGTPSPDLSYQWYRCTSAVTQNLSFASVPSGCTAISGATDASYTPVAADRTRYVTVRITAANGDSPNAVAIAASSSLTLYAPYFTNAFVNISGGGAIGSTVSAGYAVFSRPSATLSYQWYDCVDQVLSPDLTTSTPPGDCTAISGATSSTYTIQSSDAGSYVTVTETASNGISPDAGAVANSTDLIDGPVGLRAITISGTATAGSTLTSDVSTYGEPAVSSMTYQWYRCTDLVDGTLNAGAAPGICTAIAAATAASYTIDGATDAGSTILLDVSVSGGTTSSEGYSTSTDLVTGPPGFSSLVLDHSAIVGDTLMPTAVAFGYPAPTVTYIWYQCTSAPADTLSASGAGGATYLAGYGCTALTSASSSSSFDTSSSTAGDILALAATATYGLSSSTAVSSTTLQAP